MPSYIPPALRQKQEAGTEAKATAFEYPTAVSLQDVEAHFWPPEQRGPDYTETISRTLHGCAANPNELAYVILFLGANPQWAEERTIFAKSNLDLLPAHIAEDDSQIGNFTSSSAGYFNNGTLQNATDVGAEHSNKNSKDRGQTLSNDGSRSPVVAVFQEERSFDNRKGIVFDGWYKIAHLQFLKPESPELGRMLEQKWTASDRHGKTRQKTRDYGAWQESMRHRWAVIKLTKDEAATQERGLLKIKRIEKERPDAKDEKTVNEILAELRKKG